MLELLGPVAITAAIRDAAGTIRDFRYEYVNPAFAAVLGETPDALVGHCLLELYPSHVELGLFDHYRRVVEDQEVWETELPFFDERRAQGYFHITVHPFADGYVVQGRDVGAEHAEAVAAHERLSDTVDAIPEAVVVMAAEHDHDGNLVDFTYEHVNQAFRDLTQHGDEELVGRRLSEVGPTDRERGLIGPYRRVAESDEPFSAELPWFDEENLHGFIEVTVNRFNSGVIATARDITARRRLEEQHSMEVLTDPLTGLSNRRMLLDRIEHALSSSLRDTDSVAVLYLDLDHFKDVNDTLGHDAGDHVLCEAARRLVLSLRPSDTVARLGGDEFVVVLTNAVEPRDPAVIAQRLIEALDQPIPVAGTSVRLGCSVGITTSTNGDDAEDLVRQADLAMYRAKRRNGDRFEFFDQKISAEVHDRVALEQALRMAIDGGEFEAWYQPEVDLRTGRVVGFEALARWRRADGSVRPAEEWVEHAEESGLIIRLDRALRHRTLAEFARWPRPGLTALVRIWLNVSARELVEPDTAEVLLGTIKESGLRPTDVGIEITETALVADPTVASRNVDRLVEAGLRIAVDDFGTGFASLASLRSWHVDTLKIDRIFTQGVPGDAFDDAVVAATVALSDTLDLGIVGEGIETIAQRDALAEMGCTTGQGFLFSPALPPEQAAAMLIEGALA